MSNQDEEQQLLKDASTLLMFANVAAKQQVQAQVPAAQVVSPQQGIKVPLYHMYGSSNSILNSTGPSILNQLGYQGYYPVPTAAPVAAPASAPASSLVQSPVFPYKQTLQSPPQIHTTAPVYHPHVSPSAKSQPQPLVNTPILPQPSFPQHAYRSKNSLDSIMNSDNTAQPVLKSPPSLPRSSRSSISSLMNSEPTLLGKPIVKKEREITPKEETEVALKEVVLPVLQKIQKSVSPTSQLPSKGSFVSHKRSKSTPQAAKKLQQKKQHIEQQKEPINNQQLQHGNLQHNQQQLPMPQVLPVVQHIPMHQYHLSPTPAAALARGINLETGERNNNNAMIAAAALAAAADIPFPLKVVSPSKAVDKREEEELTEPEVEDDENKTDDERTEDEAPVIKKTPEFLKTEVVIPVVPLPVEQVIGTKGETKHREIAPKVLTTTKAITPKEVTPVEPTPKLTPKPPPTNLPQENSPEAPIIKATAPIEALPEGSTQNEDAAVDQKDVPKFKAPPLQAYQVDPDSGLIGCICDIDDDDGFTIQCDVCFRWQHCLCMGFKTNDEVPEDEYKCYYCDPEKLGKFSPQLCYQQTIRRLDLDKSDRSKSGNYTSNGNTDDDRNTHALPKRKRLGSDKSTDKKRRVGSGEIVKRKETTPEALIVTVPEDVLPNKDNELLHDGITAESYQSVYFNLKSNDYKRPSIKEVFSKLGSDFYKEFLAQKDPGSELRGIEVISELQFKLLKMSRVQLPNHLKYLLENKINILKKNKYNKTMIQVKAYSDNQKQKFNGISKMALFISSPGADSPVTTIPENTAIVTYLGELDLFDNYASDEINQYASWGTPKPKVLKTFLNTLPPVDVVLDSRFVGNESRFLRKSCPATANCTIKPYYIPETNTFQFVVVTSEPITLKSDATEELRLSWEWDINHPILKLYENSSSEKFESLSNNDKSALISSVDNILYFAECGCSTSNLNAQCAIFKVKKATSYLLRSTRKVSLISNVNLTKSKEELIYPKMEKEYHSWKERLLQRDSLIQLDLLVTNTDTAEELPKNDSIAIVDEDALPAETDSNLFKLPFKQQLISRRRDLLNSIESIRIPPPTDLADTSEESLFPIVPDVVIRIEQTISNKLKPIVKEVEARLIEKIEINKIAVEVNKGEDSIEILKKDEVVKENSSTANKVPLDLAVETPTAVVMPAPVKSVDSVAAPVVESAAIVPPIKDTHPPKIIKKLSFADYKKKMKE